MSRRVVKVVMVAAAISVATTASCSSSSKSSSSLVVKDVAAAAGAGLADATNNHGEDCVADFDGDGRPDVLLSTHIAVWPLLRGLPNGRFEPYYKGLDPGRVDRHGCAVADYNGDGLLDVYMSVGACEGKCKAPKELWIQRPDHTFVNEASKWGIIDPLTRGRVPVVLNANGDKLPDLFAGQEKGVKYPSFSKLWINRGDHFELHKGLPTGVFDGSCAAAADIDGNGFDDLAVCTRDQGFHIFRNDHGVFVEATKSFGLQDHGRRAAEFPELNGDRRPDLVTVTQTVVVVYLNEGGHYGHPVFEQKVAEGKDVAFGDVDGDGDLDMYIQQSARTNDADQIFLNQGDGRFVPGPKLPSAGHGAGDPKRESPGDSVVAIPDWKGTGRAAFLVNNGFLGLPDGKRQLFEFSGG